MAAPPAPGDALGRPFGDHAPAALAALGPEVQDPVGLGDHVQVVLDHHHGVAGVDQAVQHAHQPLDVGHVQAHGGLVEQVQGGLGAPPRARVRGLGAHARELGDELDALRLAAGERGAGLAEREIAEADVAQQLQRVADARMGGEEIHGLVHAHGEDVRDAAPVPAHLERLGGIAAAAADLAGDLHVRQEAHLDGAHALPFAGLAAPPGDVEGEAPGPPPAQARLGGGGVEAAHLVEQPHVGGGAGARRAADGRLVHLEHAPEPLVAAHGLAAHGGAPAAAAADEAREAGVEDAVHERALARARDAGHAHQPPERDAHVDAAQVVQARALDHEPFVGGRRRAAREPRQGVARRVGEHAARDGPRRARDVGDGALGHHAPAARAGPGAEVDDVLGAADGLLVVLDHEHGVAARAQRLEGVEQARVVARVQADGGLVEHVAHAPQAGAELGGEPDALRLAAGERGRGAVEAQVAEADALEKGEPRADLVHHGAADGGLAPRQAQAREPAREPRHRQRRELGDAAPAEAHRERLGPQPAPAAGGAGARLALVALVPPGLLAGLGLVEACEQHARAVAARAPAVRRAPGEQPRVRLREAAPAARAGAPRGVHLDLAGGRAAAPQGQHVHDAVAEGERPLERGAQLALDPGPQAQARHGQLDGVLAVAVEPRPGIGGHEGAVDAQARMPARRRPLRELAVDALAPHHQRREQLHLAPAPAAQEPRGDGLRRLRLDRHVAVRAVLHAEAEIEQAQEVVDLGEGADGAPAPAAAGALLDRHRGRDAEHGVDVGAGRRLHELARVGVEALEVAALALGEDDVEGERALARARDAGHGHEPPARDVHRDVAQVVLARVQHADRGRCARFPLRSGRRRRGRGAPAVRAGPRRRGLEVRAQGTPGVARRAGGHLLHGAGHHHLAARLAALRTQVHDPVGGGDHVQVVLHDDERVPGLEQALERAQQHLHVGRMQARGGLVEQQQRAARGRAGARRPRLRQVAGELQALGLAPRERGHGLAEPQIAQPHGAQRLEGGQHLGVAREEGRRLLHRHVEHVGDRGRRQAAARGRLEHDLQHLGAVAAPVALGAAQVDVGEELHLDVLEARALAGGAAAVAGVEAEGAGRVAALARARRGGEAPPDRIPGADVARRAGARGAPDGRLVHQHHVRQVAVAAQAPVRPRRLAAQAEAPAQGPVQHRLDERGLARARHARDAHEAVERQGDVDALEVVGAGAAHLEPARGAVRRAAPARAPRPQAPREIAAGGGAGRRHRRRRARGDDAPAALARPRAQVEDAVGGAHELRVVLDHHQRVARRAQAPQHAHQARGVARVEADRGLVEHEERVDQRGAERRGEVDALHLAAGERARLAVEREVAEPDLVEVAQARADLAEQELGRLVEGRGEREALEEGARARDGQRRELVQREPRKRAVARPRQAHAPRAHARGGREDGIRFGAAAEAPPQRLRAQARAAAVRAGVVAAVAREQHADVHPVALALEPLEEAAHPVPDALVEVALALQHPAALGRRQPPPGHVHGDAARAREAQQVLLALGVAPALEGPDGALGEAERGVGHHQVPVDADHAPEAAAGGAGADRRVEGEQRRRRLGELALAVRAVQGGGVAQRPPARAPPPVERLQVHAPAAMGERGLDRLGQARARGGLDPQPVLHHLEPAAAAAQHARPARARQEALHLPAAERFRHLHREGHGHALAGEARERLLDHGLGRVAAHLAPAAGAVQARGARVEELEVVGELGHGAHRRARGAHRVGLVDGDRRRDALDALGPRPVHALEELARVGREGLDVAALALGVEGVEGERALARAGDAGDDHQLAERQVEVDAAQVVLARAAHADHAALGRGGRRGRLAGLSRGVHRGAGRAAAARPASLAPRAARRRAGGAGGVSATIWGPILPPLPTGSPGDGLQQRGKVAVRPRGRRGGGPRQPPARREPGRRRLGDRIRAARGRGALLALHPPALRRSGLRELRGGGDRRAAPAPAPRRDAPVGRGERLLPHALRQQRRHRLSRRRLSRPRRRARAWAPPRAAARAPRRRARAASPRSRGR